MLALRVLASILFVLCIPAALLTTSIRFLANEPRVYRYAIDDFDGVATTGIERGELIRAGGELRDYFNNGDERVAIRVKQGAREVPLFNSRETDHLKDVKSRFRAQNRVQEFAVLYVIAYVAVVVLWSREVSVRFLAVQTVIGCAVTLAVIGGVGLFSLGGFDSAWLKFHEIMFSNQFWLLNPRTDHLIQIFPPDFWESIVFFIGILTAAEAGLLLVLSGIYLGVTGHEQHRVELAPSFG